MGYLPSETFTNRVDFFKEHYGSLKSFAPHIHVLYREVPFILNITTCLRGQVPRVAADRLAQDPKKLQSADYLNSLSLFL